MVSGSIKLRDLLEFEGLGVRVARSVRGEHESGNVEESGLNKHHPRRPAHPAHATMGSEPGATVEVFCGQDDAPRVKR